LSLYLVHLNLYPERGVGAGKAVGFKLVTR
jgi:hypothetical protein